MPVIQFESRSGELVLLDVEHIAPGEEDEILAAARRADQANLNRAFAELRVRELSWNARATGAQKAIGWGDYAVMRYEPPAGDPAGWLPVACTIYGYVLTRAQFRRAECAAAANLARHGVAARDVEDSVARTEAAFTRGWRYGRWHSKIEPAGEPGEQHVVNLTAITARQFRDARRDGWPDEVPPERER